MNFWTTYGEAYLIISDSIAYYTQSEFLLFLLAMLNLPIIKLGFLRGLE